MQRGFHTSMTVAVGIGAFVVIAAGSAVAVPSVHSAISGSSIKNRSIGAAKLKNNTLTGKQVKANSLTGKQVNESTLGIVPAAKAALNSLELGGKPASDFVPSSRELTFTATMSEGDADKTLGTLGPITFGARCINDGGSTDGVITATTTVADTQVYSGSGNLFGPGEKLVVVTDEASGEDYNTVSPVILTPDGSLLVDGGDSLLVSVNNLGHDCVFGGHLVNDAG